MNSFSKLSIRCRGLSDLREMWYGAARRGKGGKPWLRLDALLLCGLLRTNIASPSSTQTIYDGLHVGRTGVPETARLGPQEVERIIRNSPGSRVSPRYSAYAYPGASLSSLPASAPPPPCNSAKAKGADPNRGGRRYPGVIIPEGRARSNRNAERDHRGFVGDSPRNPELAARHSFLAPEGDGLSLFYRDPSFIKSICWRARNTILSPALISPDTVHNRKATLSGSMRRTPQNVSSPNWCCSA